MTHVNFYYNLSKHFPVPGFIEIIQVFWALLHADKDIYPRRPKYLWVNKDSSR